MGKSEIFYKKNRENFETCVCVLCVENPNGNTSGNANGSKNDNGKCEPDRATEK